MKLTHLAGLAIAALLTLGAAVADAQTLPQVTSINPTDLIQVIPRGVPSAGNQYASTTQLAGFGISAATKINALIGGDAGTNLFQRATTGSSVTTTITYGGPDRWAYWSGTNTAMTVSRDTTAADLPASGSYQAAFKMARTSGQTGVVPLCMVQEVESVNSYMFQGATAELDFWATAGANFSAANSALTAYIITGTGTDEGVSKMAFAFNAGGGGSSTWTGQATTVADVATISTVPTRFAAVGVIPAGTTEIGVVFCYTPVGTAGTNDYVALTGIQLSRNAALTSIASQTTATDCSTINCSSYDRRLIGQETALQQRYFYKIAESAAITVIAPCANSTTSLALCQVPFPTTMRTAPTMTYTTGFAANTTTAMTAVTACTSLGTSTAVASTAANVQGVLVACGSSAGFGAAGTTSFLYSNNGSGVINASAEL